MYPVLLALFQEAEQAQLLRVREQLLGDPSALDNRPAQLTPAEEESCGQ